MAVFPVHHDAWTITPIADNIGEPFGEPDAELGKMMPRGYGRLKPLQIDRFKGPGKLSDGGGLYLIAGGNGSRSWVFRYTRRGIAVELGLGASRAVPLPDARQKAAGLRAVLASGAMEGNLHQMVNQLIGVAMAWALAIVGTLIILKIVDATIGLRVEEEHETQGLDLSQHGEEGYYWEASA